MSLQRIPLSDAPDQEFSITLDGVLYFLRLRLNFRMQLWTMDIKSSEQAPLAYGLVLVPGTDLIQPYSLEGLTRFFAINLDTPEDFLSVENLSVDGGLFYDQTI